MNNYAIVKNNIVINLIVWDGIAEFSPDVGEVIIAPNGVVIGWGYENGEFIAPPIVQHAMTVDGAEQERQALLAQANAITADWRIELSLGIIDDEDKAKLTVWMKYIKALKAVDISPAPDVSWPEPPPVL